MVHLIQKRLFLSICFCFAFFSLKASHLAGAEITYQCVGPYQYQVSLVIYRDCGGINLATTETINYSSAACGTTSSAALQLISVTDITPVCPSGSSSCGGSGAYGIERILYSGIITLPIGCNDWILSYEECCRSGDVTNVSAPSSSNLYVETRLNNALVPCNNSPTFSAPPQLFTCVGEDVVFSQLAFDPDGDDLVYSLVNSQQTTGSSVPYAGGFSGVNPFTSPATINPSTGVISFNVSVPQVAVIAVKVEEYRGGVLIGYVIRDVQIFVLACTNQFPIIGGINGVAGATTISTCVGAPLCFTFTLTDPDAGQNLVAQINNLMPGAVFTISGAGNNKLGTICWSPSSADLGVHQFNVSLSDNNCPLIGTTNTVLSITVIPNPNLPVNAGLDQSICLGQSANLTASTAALNGVSYTWSPALGLSTTSGNATTATPTSTTNYSVSLTYSDGCVGTDIVQVTVNNPPAINLYPQTINVCAGASVLLSGSTNQVGANFQWFDNAMTLLGSGTVVGLNTSISVTIPNAPGSYVYTFRVTNPVTGCFSTTTATVTVGNPPVVQSCANIYVSPVGASAAAGTQADPTSLAEAITRAGCSGAVVKMAIGTYTLNAPLFLPSFITLEGGFNPASAWEKTSLAGATTITRSATSPEGVVNQQRLVAFYANSASGFRLQDITITTVNANLPGMSTYGLHLTNCSNYFIVRTQILPGAGAAGDGDNNVATYNSTWDGANGTNGVAGTTGGGPQCSCSLGTDLGGTGGNGGAAGNGGLNALIIGGSATNGGAGGVGGAGRPDNSGLAGFAGVAGTTAPSAGGTGGTAGAGGPQDNNGNATSAVGNGGAGVNGANGVNGTVGVSTYVTGFFTPGLGTNGTAARGGGGGGGGGGAGRDTDGCDAAGGGGSGGNGGGGGGGAGRGAHGGGGSFGLYLFNNGTGGNVIQSRIVAGTAGVAGIGGSGGNGGTGPTNAIGNGCVNGDTDGNRGGSGGKGGNGGTGGAGGSGQVGVSLSIRTDGGVSLTTSDANFSLSGQPTILVQNISCTNTNLNYTSASSDTWDFDLVSNNATPATSPSAITSTTAYSTVGRYSVSFGANNYTGFHNVAFGGTTPTDILSSAAVVATDVYQVCLGDLASFNSVYLGDSYIWNFGGAIPNPGNIQNVSTIFNTGGYFTITLGLITDCCGLSPVKTIHLFVIAPPTLSNSGVLALCAEDSLTLTLNGTSASNSIAWSPPIGLISNAGNTAIVSPTSSTSYIATVNTSMTNGGNTAVGCPVSFTFPVTVNSNPIITLTPASVICNNDGSITASVSPSASYNFTWSNGLNVIGATSSMNSTLAAGAYNVNVINPLTGCETVENTVVFPSPTQPVAYIQSNTTTCIGTSTGSVVVNSSGGTSPYSYFWNGSSTTISATSITQSGLAPGNYPVVVTDNNGCISNLLVNVNGEALPEYEPFIMDSICVGENAVFNFLGTDGAVLTYNFGGPSNTLILSHDDTVSVSIAGVIPSQTIFLTQIVDDCVLPLSVSIPIVVESCALPVNLEQFSGTCLARKWLFKWTVSFEQNNDKYVVEGSVNGSDFEYISELKGTESSADLKEYYLVAEQNSFTYFRLKQVDLDGIEKIYPPIYMDCALNKGTDLLIVPNPATDFINVTFYNELADFEGEIQIVDLLGRIVEVLNFNATNGANQVYVNTKHFQSGQYVLKMTNQLGEKNEGRFIVIK